MKRIKEIMIMFMCISLLVPGAGAVPIGAYRSYVRGLLAAKAGDLYSAMDAYQRVVAADKKAAGAYKELAMIYWQLGMAKEAFYTAQMVDQLSGDQPDTQLFLGNFYIMTGYGEKAAACWKKVLAKEAENETAVLYLAAYYTDKEPEKAVEYWKKYTGIKPEAAAGYYQLGLVEEKLGRYENAKESYKKAVEIEPSGTDAHLSLAQVYEKQNDTYNALLEYEKYLVISPDNLTVLLYVGGYYYRLKMYDKAQEKFETALKVNPKDINTYFWLGLIAEQKKDWKSAIKHFEGLRKTENSVAVLTRLSYYYSASRNSKKAIKCLQEAEKLDVNNANTYYLLGLAYFDSKKISKAEKSFKRSIQLNPEFEDSYFHLGVLYDTKGKFEKAVPVLEKAIQVNPNYASALNYLGYSLADRGIKMAIAKELVKRAVELSPDNGAYMDSLGWVNYKNGQYEEAEQWVSAAANKISDPVVFEHLGDIKMKLNSSSEAWDAYQHALMLNGKNKKLSKKLKEVETLLKPEVFHKRMLKIAIGNLCAIQSLKADFALNAKAGDINVRNYGVLKFNRPEQFRVDVFGSFLAPGFVVLWDNGYKIYPRALDSQDTSRYKTGFDSIRKFFTCDLINEFDTDKTVVEDKGSSYIYKINSRSITIDKKTATVSSYSRNGELMLKFSSQSIQEGLLIPQNIEAYMPQTGLSCTIKIKNFIINGVFGEKDFNVEQ